MKRVILGLILGSVAGVIDVIPMLIQKLPLAANLAAFSMWVVIGIVLACNNLKLHGALKGLIFSLLILTPSAIVIGSSEVITLIPIVIMTALLGTILGLMVEKVLNLIKNYLYL